MKDKAQTSLEYLLIIVVVLGVITAVFVFIQSSSEEAKNISSENIDCSKCQVDKAYRTENLGLCNTTCHIDSSRRECSPGETFECDTGLFGICAQGEEKCTTSLFVGPCEPINFPVVEICDDGLDNDCDNLTDYDDDDCATACPAGMDGHGTYAEPCLVETPTDLQAICEVSNFSYLIIQDIDLTGISWQPLCTEADPFQGVLDGDGNSITNLNVDIAGNNAGLFAFLEGEVKDILLESVSVKGEEYVGALAGNANGASITSVLISGSTSSSASATIIGGFFGYDSSSTIYESSYSGTVSGEETGGIIGEAHSSQISDSYFSGTVTGPSNAGGFIDKSYSSTISNSYFSGEVTGWNSGGLIYEDESSSVINSYVTGTVEGCRVGGLIYDASGSSIRGSFAIPTFQNRFSSTICTFKAGGIAYNKDAGTTIADSYWLDIDTNAPNDCYNGGNEGCHKMTTTSVFKNYAYYPINSWSFPPWDASCNEQEYPRLLWQGDSCTPVTPVGDDECFVFEACVDGHDSILMNDGKLTIAHHDKDRIGAHGGCPAAYRGAIYIDGVKESYVNPYNMQYDIPILSMTSFSRLQCRGSVNAIGGGLSINDPAGGPYIYKIGICGAPVQPLTLEDGLVLYLPFDDPSNPGEGVTDHGTTSTDGMCSYAREFDGSSYLSKSFSQPSVWTASVWVKTEALPAVASFVTFENNYAMDLQVLSTGAYRLQTAQSNWIDTPDTYSANTWHHVVYGYDGSDAFIYVDNEFAFSAPRAGAIGNSLEIGRRMGEYYFTGALDELRVYNRVLSETEIDELYYECKDSLSKNQVLYLPFNDPDDIKGDSVPSDFEGDITDYGTISTDGTCSYARAFDGGSDYIEISNTDEFDFGTGNFSYCFWFNQMASTTDQVAQLLSKRDENAGNFEAQIYNGVLTFLAGNDMNDIIPRTDADVEINTNRWYHLCFVRENEVANAYLDAIETASFASVGNINSESNLFIGRDPHHASGNLAEFFNGVIDEMRFWNKALTTSEIDELYDECKDSASKNTVIYLPFNNPDNVRTGVIPSALAGAVSNHWSSSAYGTCSYGREFNGVDNYIELENEFTFSKEGAASISLWMKADSGESDGTLISFRDGDNGRTVLDIGIGFDGSGASTPPNKIGILVRGDDNELAQEFGASSSFDINDGLWHHIVGIVDLKNSVVKLFIDGSLEDTNTGNINGDITGKLNSIGAELYWNLFESITEDRTFFEGMIDEVRVYDYELSESEIDELYEECRYGASDNLVAYLPFNDPDDLNEGVIPDNLAGTFTNQGTTATEGVCDYAREFDGSDYIHKDTFNSVPSSKLGICSWVKTTSNGVIVQQGRSPGDANSEYVFRVYNHRLNFWDYDNAYGFGFTQTSNTALDDGNWHYVCFVKNGQEGTYYLDGNSDGTVTASKDCSYSPNDFVIGNDFRDNTQYFNGAIDELKIYNYELSEDDIKDLYGECMDSSYDCQLCRRYADVNGRDTAPWSCVNFNNISLLTNFAGNVNGDDDFDLKVSCVSPQMQNDCQLCRRYADVNGRDTAPWSCVNFDDTPLLTDFVGDVNYDDDFDLKVSCVSPQMQNDCQLCRRYADVNGRDTAPWDCVNFDDTPLLTDFVGDVNHDDDFDLKVVCN